jgi:hypothetical protein
MDKKRQADFEDYMRWAVVSVRDSRKLRGTLHVQAPEWNETGLRVQSA